MTDWRARDPVRGARETANSCFTVLRVLRESSSPVAVMGFRAVLLSFLLVSLSWTRGAVITGVSETFSGSVALCQMIFVLLVHQFIRFMFNLFVFFIYFALLSNV